jgi:hypothetical protein
MIHVLDALTVRPGQLAEVRARVREVYAPALSPFGTRLAHTWIAPPVELHDDPVELLLLWEYADTPTFWKVRREAWHDDAVLGFWRDVEPLLLGRTRRIMVDADDQTVLR